MTCFRIYQYFSYWVIFCTSNIPFTDKTISFSTWELENGLPKPNDLLVHSLSEVTQKPGDFLSLRPKCGVLNRDQNLSPE